MKFQKMYFPEYFKLMAMRQSMVTVIHPSFSCNPHLFQAAFRLCA